MPAKYSVVAKVNPQDPEGPRKFYPSYKSSSRANRRTLALEAADRSTPSDADMDWTPHWPTCSRSSPNIPLLRQGLPTSAGAGVITTPHVFQNAAQ